MARIGIMGGTFNPIHNAHIHMAWAAKTQFNLDCVWFMPSKNPPHKDNSNIVSEEHRKRMIEHAIYEYDGFEFSDIELKREGTTYTRDTLEFLTQKYPEHSWFFILGGDSLASFEQWRDPAYIASHCTILIAGRDETSGEEIEKYINLYKEKYNANMQVIHMENEKISSELIRSLANSGKSLQNMCPTIVERYISFHQLYGYSNHTKEKYTNREIEQILQCCLKPKRYQHTLGVAFTAANMASIHGVDSDLAYRAGLLHDCAKYLTNHEQLATCKKYKIPYTSIEKNTPSLLHSKLGCYYAEHFFHETDSNILNAICYHTTGRPEMSSLEKIIYLADYIEPGRTTKPSPYSLNEIRKACFKNLNKAMYMTLKCCITYLKEENCTIDETSKETYQYYKKKYKSERK